jgi:hypothetical protein
LSARRPSQRDDSGKPWEHGTERRGETVLERAAEQMGEA